MKKLIALFDFSILTGTNRNVIKDSLGKPIQPVSIAEKPTLRTVKPNDWLGADATKKDVTAWMKRNNVSTTYSRFDGGNGKLQLERFVRGEM
jgi:hypothetical protein